MCTTSPATSAPVDASLLVHVVAGVELYILVGALLALAFLCTLEDHWPPTQRALFACVMMWGWPVLMATYVVFVIIMQRYFGSCNHVNPPQPSLHDQDEFVDIPLDDPEDAPAVAVGDVDAMNGPTGLSNPLAVDGSGYLAPNTNTGGTLIFSHIYSEIKIIPILAIKKSTWSKKVPLEKMAATPSHPPPARPPFVPPSRPGRTSTPISATPASAHLGSFETAAQAAATEAKDPHSEVLVGGGHNANEVSMISSLHGPSQGLEESRVDPSGRTSAHDHSIYSQVDETTCRPSRPGRGHDHDRDPPGGAWVGNVLGAVPEPVPVRIPSLPKSQPSYPQVHLDLEANRPHAHLFGVGGTPVPPFTPVITEHVATNVFVSTMQTLKANLGHMFVSGVPQFERPWSGRPFNPVATMTGFAAQVGAAQNDDTQTQLSYVTCVSAYSRKAPKRKSLNSTQRWIPYNGKLNFFKICTFRINNSLFSSLQERPLWTLLILITIKKRPWRIRIPVESAKSTIFNPYFVQILVI